MSILRPNLPSIYDEEGASVPRGLPRVVDAHIYIFPHDIFSVIRHWFDEKAWRIRYQLKTSKFFEFLLSHGVAHVVALQYAHKQGISEKLNRYMAQKCREYPGRITELATVFPGEGGAERTLQAAFDSGLSGLKLHAHVQCFDMNADEMNPLIILLEHKWSVTVQTKSSLVLRNIEILEKFKNIVLGFSITTADEKIREIFEPGAFPIKERIHALEVLHFKDIPAALVDAIRLSQPDVIGVSLRNIDDQIARRELHDK